jgi:acyl-CoA thioesterase FadM
MGRAGHDALGTVAVLGEGDRAADWAARFLAAGRRVLIDDPTLRSMVVERWNDACLLGSFSGASVERLEVIDGTRDLSDCELVHVADGRMQPPGAPLVSTERTVVGHQPIHVVPLVEIRACAEADQLDAFFRRIGMTICRSEEHPLARWQLGPGLVEFTAGDPSAIAAIMRSLRGTDHLLGRAVERFETARLSAGGIAPWQPGHEVDAPLRIYAANVEAEWVDYNAHMTEAAYLTAAGWASDALFRYIGDDEAYRAAGHSFYTVETHIHYRAEASAHEPIEFTTQVLGVDAKRLHLVHEMWHGTTGDHLCTVEQMLLHVDMVAGRSAPILPHVAAALAAIAEAHANLPVPAGVGSVMRLPAARS